MIWYYESGYIKGIIECVFKWISGSRNRAHLAWRSFFSRLRAIFAESKNIIDAIWISGLSCARASNVQMNLVILVPDNDHNSDG